MKRIFLISSVVCFGILFGGLITEFSLRLLGFEHNTLSILYDRDCYWRLAPNQRFHFIDESNTLCFVGINSLGARGPEIPQDKPPHEKRLICLGDSYTYGWGVDQGNSFPAQLQTLLVNQPNPFNVINYGCNGYTILQEVNLLKKYGLQLKPDYVLLDASLNTDFLDIDELPINLKYMVRPGYNLVKTFVRKTAIGNLLLRIWSQRKGREIASFRKEEMRAQNQPLSDYPRPSARTFNVYIDKLDELVKLSKEQGFKLIYVISPWQTLTLNEALIGDFTYQGKRITTAQQFYQILLTRYGRDMTVVELMTPFRDHRLFLKDGHLNAKGNAQAAEIIYSKIKPIL
jgi:lysophospholipase L1-like esterase